MKVIQGRKKLKRRAGLKTIAVMVLIICGIVTYSRTKLDQEAAELAKQVESLNRQIDEEDARTAEREEQRAYIQTKKYIEDMAREKLGLVYPDEIIFEEEE